MANQKKNCMKKQKKLKIVIKIAILTDMDIFQGKEM